MLLGNETNNKMKHMVTEKQNIMIWTVPSFGHDIKPSYYLNFLENYLHVSSTYKYYIINKCTI